ncbi:hypothetical protein [Rhodoferax koreensis]|nr:hypothetical protein [Rhodoferax koreense]
MQPVWVALIAAGGAAVGWFVNHWLAVRREEGRRRLEAQLKFVERQIEELYGPLAAALYEGRRTFRDLLESLGRNYVFPPNGELPEDELRTWLFWAESEFLPRNEYVKTLLKTKAHLIYGGEFPESYVKFLDHCNSWAVNHRRWKEQQVTYSWHSKINWPEDFEVQAIETFQTLKRHHADLIGALMANPSFQRTTSGGC